MARKIEIVKQEELHSNPVMHDLKAINEKDLLSSYKNKSGRGKRMWVIMAIVLIALLYAAARLRI